MESFDSHCKAFSFFGFDLLSADSYWHILFYAILFYCEINNYIFFTVYSIRSPTSRHGVLLFRKANYIVWILISIWLIGILVKCIFYVRDCISLRKILNQSTYSQSDAVLDKIVRDLTKRLHLTHVPCIRYCSLTSTPVTVKKHKFIIILPQRSYSSNELYAILLHEMIHIKHNDLRKLKFGRILTIIFWFYPIAYLFRRDIELLCETVCYTHSIAPSFQASDSFLHWFEQ